MDVKETLRYAQYKILRNQFKSDEEFNKAFEDAYAKLTGLVNEKNNEKSKQ